MNSQQELLDAINTITQSKDRSCDTPATVLRVEGDTVWVHIDGGADETPVQKTINCSEGETVQVRISNGSAFLVGNASAPPTDDTTANVAHFIAEEADVKATEAIRTANAIVQTVQGKVDSGNSNVTDLSSTMYQDAYGVNIYNDTLAVGDSYAHIDGDSFDIKEATTAGTIDNVNDTIVASFGENSYMQSRDAIISSQYYKLSMASDSIKLASIETYPTNRETGWKIDGDKIIRYGDIYSGIIAGIDAETGQIYIQDANTQMGGGGAYLNTNGEAGFFYNGEYGDSYSVIASNGNIRMTGDVYDYEDDYKKTPTVLTSETISSATTTYTFLDDAITTDSVIDIYDTIFGFSPTGMTVSTGSCTITFSAQSSTHTIKLFVY